MSAFTRISGIMLALAVIALPVVALMQGWIGSERFALGKLRISSEAGQVHDEQLRAVLAPHAREGFFAVKLEDAQADLERLDWVEKAEVSKKWPDVLEVVITEHRPFALWDDDLLLSERGRLYPRAVMGDALPAGLPQLGGDARRVAEVVTLYNHSRELFAQSGQDVRELRLDARGSWMLRLASGTEVVLGRHETRPRLERFARLLPQLIPPPGKVLQRADLRYANGFALRWGEAQIAGKAQLARVFSSPISSGIRA